MGVSWSDVLMPDSNRDRVVQIVQVIIENNQREVLLLQRANTGFLDGHYTFPGGHVEHHEAILDAAFRECREETGIDLIVGNVELVLPYPGGVDFVIVAEQWEGQPLIGEPESCSDIAWFARDQLPSEATRVVKTVLKLLEEGVRFHQYQD